MFGLFKKRIRAKNMTKTDIDTLLLEKKPAVIMFGAPWCAACKMQKPIINDMAHHHRDHRTQIGMVDTDQQLELSAAFGITALPTIVALQDGKMVFRKKGLMSRKQLEQIYAELEKTPKI
ncbi:MAG: thioredoxin family protein [Candidatus Pacebacteria bacterium]|nr:thioredoxin family protein [Candidatus Paceibacterota bacterium]